MISVLITIFSILVIALLFFKYELGVASYVLFTFTVPAYVLNIAGFTIGWNAVLFLILALYALKKHATSVSFWQMKPFILLFFLQALMIPFHLDQEPLEYQAMMLRIDIMSLFLPFAIVNIADAKSIHYFKGALYIAIIANVIYGISLLFTPGQNPYISEINRIFGNEDADLQSFVDEGIRVFGYVSACFKQVTQTGIFLLLSFVYVFNDYIHCSEKRIKRLLLLLLVGIAVLILFCGARSAFMAGVITVCFYCLVRRKFKVVAYVGISFAVALAIMLNFFPEYAAFINSIGTEDANGSSISMRIEQFEGCLDSIKDNALFGNGYEWCHWYREVNGRHPIMLSFESIVIMILCNSGFLGILIWGLFAILCLKNFKIASSSNDNVNFCLAVTLLVAYLVYSFFTGDYGCRSQFMVFYAIYISESLIRQAKYEQ